MQNQNTVTQGTEFYSPQTGQAQGINQFDPNTGARLTQGQVVNEPATAPNNAGNINNNIPTTTIPQTGVTSPDTSTATSYLAGSQAGTQQLQSQSDKFYANQAQAQQTQNTNNQSFLSQLFGNQQSRSDLQSQEEQKLGINTQQYLTQKTSLESSISSLNKQYQDTQAQIDSQIAAANGNQASMSFINNQIAQINRNAAPKLAMVASQINFNTAQLATLNGDYTQAEGLVDKYVQNVVADQQDKITQGMAYYNANQQAFNSMQSIYKDAFTTYMTEQNKILDEQKSNAKDVGTLSINYPTAGILPTDTIQQAEQKVVRSGGNTSGTSEDINGRKVNVIRDSQGNIIKQTDIGAAGSGTGDIPSDVQQTMDSVLSSKGSSGNWSLKDWNDSKAGFVSQYASKLGGYVKASNIFKAQFPTPPKNTGGFTGAIGDFFSNLFHTNG